MQTGRDYFEEMGISHFINAAAPYSSLGGSQMWPEVIEAMDYAMIRRARMKELHDAVGVRIAAMAGSEAAMVTAGATSAMTLGTAACIAGTNPDLIHRLPETTGMKDEVIIQRGHQRKDRDDDVQLQSGGSGRHQSRRVGRARHGIRHSHIL